MTKEEATAKWCPMARLTACSASGHVGLSQTVFNRLQNGVNTAVPDSARCLADQCAMWRWEEGRAPGSPRLGFCGLAGVPFGAAA
ncbi:MAG TPA: hypothetical protein VF797_01510 [Noviherbaspirillum sp.]